MDQTQGAGQVCGIAITVIDRHVGHQAAEYTSAAAGVYGSYKVMVKGPLGRGFANALLQAVGAALRPMSPGAMRGR